MKIGLIDYYLDEYHANHYPEWIKKASNGTIEAVYAYADIDSPIGGKTTDAWCEEMKIERVHSIEEIVEKSDGLIVLSPDNPEQHERLCEIPLKSGKPTYVDKTFALTKDIALRIFENAHKNNTPCYSASSVRFAVEYKNIDKSQVESITSLGPGPLSNYTIHQLEPVIMLMGADVERVKFTGTERWPAYVLEWKDGRRAHFSHHGWECPFTMAVAFQNETSEVIKIESDFYAQFITGLVEFFNTKKVQVPHEETIAIMTVREAIDKASSATKDTWVKL